MALNCFQNKIKMFQQFLMPFMLWSLLAYPTSFPIISETSLLVLTAYWISQIPMMHSIHRHLYSSSNQCHELHPCVNFPFLSNWPTYFYLPLHLCSVPPCSFHFPETAPLLLPSCIITPYFGFLRKDGSERSCSPVLFLWPNWINLSLTPNTSVSGFGLAADQAHKPVFWEVVSNNSIYRKKFEYEGTPAVQTSVVQG